MNIAARLKKVSRIGSHPGVYVPLVVLVVVIVGLLALRAPTTHRSDTSCEYSSVPASEFKVTFGIGDVLLTASISLPCRVGASA
jgi:hypothetical protein